MASDISGQNSSTMSFSFLKANILSSGLGSSKRDIIPAANRLQNDKITLQKKYKQYKMERIGTSIALIN